MSWQGTEPLAVGRTILLEASAGTGKTWQIEGIVVRLVAEHALPIERILVITFTNAAAAELNDRIRRRLVAARDALQPGAPPTNDPVLSYLAQEVDQRTVRWSRVIRALSEFDRAPISTIHGFSQRMLDQLAFESNQESELELQPDLTELLDELIADERASVYAQADATDLDVLDDMGWNDAGLHTIAKEMTRAVAPVPSPELTEQDARAGALELAARWRRQADTLLTWLDGAEGRDCEAAIEAERTRGKKGPQKRADGRYLGLIQQHRDLDKLRKWLANGAQRSARFDSRTQSGWFKRLTIEQLREKWIDSGSDADSFEAAPLFERVSALRMEQDALWPVARVSFALRIRRRVHAELERRGLLTFDTMLSHLAERIAEQGPEGDLARAIRRRFDAALVDEFQDTDGAQWPVMRAVFAHPERRLLIIGDPKQAIYAFRGADVHVYLNAASVANESATMQTNFRSDADYVRAMNHVFSPGSGAFRLANVDYVEVTARHEATRIRGLPALDGRARRAFELRWIDARMHGADTMELTRGAAELLGARSCAREIAAILRSGAEVSEPGASGTQPNWRTIGAGDVAVLVRTHWQGALVRKELAQLHIAAVSSARGSVLKSTALPWLCTFLDALAEPGRDRIARALAVTPLFGWTALDLALALDQGRTAGGGAVEPDPRWARWIEAILGWARRYASSGFIRAFESALDAHDVLRRLLALAEGERHATDLRHLAELCHAEERRTRVGPGALATWLRKAADIATADEDKALRLESDALAVQITTVHTAKGLEYPIVMLPFGWYERGFEDDGNPIAWHERPKHAAAWIPRLDFHAANTDDRARAFDVARIEDGQERLRLTYVALTRARHHCVAWLGPITDRGRPRRGALWQLMLRERDASGRVAPDAPAPADDAAFGAREDLLAQLAQIAASSGGAVGFAVAPPQVETVPRVADPVSRDEIRALAWTGPSSLGSRFQVTSYSTLVAGRTADLEEPHRKDVVLANLALGDAAGEGLEQSPDGDNTGAAVDLNEPSADETLSGTHLAAPAPLAPMLGGKEIGTWVHAVFEHLDFPSGTSTEGEPAVLLAAALGERQGIRAGTQHALLANALPAILETPLDGAQTLLPPGFCLRQLARGDRLDELHFDLRLGAGSQYRRSKQPGDAPRNVHGCIDEGAARRALEARLDAEPGWRGAHWLQTLLERTDPREGTRKPVLPAIAGILTGAIDLIFRVGAAPESARYYVADYKTNRITSHESRRDSLLLHYTQPWLHTEMARHGYPLQALLYTIGLHRMLRQRLAGAYDYDRHMGGCLYLFLRGMQGAQCHRDGGLALGVLHERWPRHVVLGLDAALCGESPEAVSRILDAPRPEGAAR